MLEKDFAEPLRNESLLSLTLTLAACGRFRPNPNLHVFSGTQQPCEKLSLGPELARFVEWELMAPQDMPIWGALCMFLITAFFFFHYFVAVTPLVMNNQTDVTEFIFLGFSNHPNLQGLFFLIFLVIYLTTLLGNTLIIISTGTVLPSTLQCGHFLWATWVLGHLLHIHHHSSYANELLSGEEDHLLWQLPFQVFSSWHVLVLNVSYWQLWLMTAM